MPAIKDQDDEFETDVDRLRWEYKKTVLQGYPDEVIKRQLDAADGIDTTMTALMYLLGNTSGEEHSRFLNAGDAIRVRAINALKRGDVAGAEKEVDVMQRFIRSVRSETKK